jgi:hypothetical protein
MKDVQAARHNMLPALHNKHLRSVYPQAGTNRGAEQAQEEPVLVVSQSLRVLAPSQDLVWCGVVW